MASSEPETTRTLRYPIQTARLSLRPHRMGDLDDLLEFHSDPAVVRFLPWPLRDRAATEQALGVKLDQSRWPESGQWLVLAVELRTTGTVIGEVLLKSASAEHRQGELGFAFGRDFHGHGYAAEASRAMLSLGFEDLAMHRITAVCLEHNDASARLLQRLGFEQQARLVDNIFFKGAWATQLVYALTEDQWRAGDASRDGDIAELGSLVRRFFEAFSTGDGIDTRLEALRAAMLPEAIVVRTGGQRHAVYDVESFIEPRRTMLTDGSLVDFREHAVSGRFEIFGDVAHWFGRYTKHGTLRGVTESGGGMKSIQFVRTNHGWRISAAAWDDERSDLTADTYTSTIRHADPQA